MPLLALSNGDVILLVVIVAIPVVALSFLGAGAAFQQIGKGAFAIEQEPRPKRGAPLPPVPREVREAEIRQMLEAKAYRQAARGQAPLDIDAELGRILAADEAQPARPPAADPELVAEVRSLVEASNARRIRMGRAPLDVDAEVERQLRDLESPSG